MPRLNHCFATRCLGSYQSLTALFIVHTISHMPKLKLNTIIPTAAEEALIQAGIDSDPDAYSLTDAEWAAVQPFVKMGQPKAEITKERITIRLSRDVLSSFRATGQGWQTRVDGALRQYILEHPLSNV